MLLKTNFFSIKNDFDSDGKVAAKTPESTIISKKTNIENSENILIIYEPDDGNSDITTNTDLVEISLPHMEHDLISTPNSRNMVCFDETIGAKPYRFLKSHNKENEDIESCQTSIDITPKILHKSIEKPEVATSQSDRGKKRKFKPILKEKDIGRQSLVNKKMEVLEKKSSILDIIKEVEIENLKSKKIENEIKEIELKIKLKEYDKLSE